MNWLVKQQLMAQLAGAVARRSHSEVVDICDAILRHDSRDVAAFTMKANALEALGREHDAAASWQEVMSIDASDFTALRKLTDYYRRIGESELARAYAARAISAYAPARLSASNLKFLRFIGRLFGASRDMADVAMKDEARMDANDAQWVAEARSFLGEAKPQATS